MSAFGSFAGGVLGSAVDFFASRRLAEDQRSWQENMSNSAYQRSVTDMRAAGLNPMVMFGGAGAPASTPGGGTPTVSNFAGNMSAAKQVQMMDTELEAMRETIEKTGTESVVNREVAKKAVADADLARANSAVVRAQLPEHQANAALYSSKAGPALKIVERILGAVHPALGFGAGWLFRQGSGGTGVLRSEQSGRVIGRMKRR